MTIPLNDRDALLQASVIRNVTPTNAKLSLVASSSVFSEGSGGTHEPATITFTANLFEVTGIVTFNAVGCTLVVSGNIATLNYDDMTGTTATVTASLINNGVTYYSNPCSVTKVGGDSGAMDAINDPLTGLNARLRNNADQILGAVLSVDVGTNPAGFRAGSLTWNAAGVRTGGYGVAMTPLGLVGYKSDGTLTFAINANTGDALFGGVLDAATGSFGAVTIATGGSISSGQTDYATGTGFWLGLSSGVPKFSIGSTSQYLRYDGTNLEIKLDTFSVVVTGTIATSKSNTTSTVSVGSLTASITGGKAPFSYVWTVSPAITDPDNAEGVVSLTAPTSATTGVNARVSQSDTAIIATVSLTVTDSSNRVATDTRFVNVQFGIAP